VQFLGIYDSLLRFRRKLGGDRTPVMLATIQSRSFCPHKIIILPVVLYGCETWSLTLREEHRLRMFENRVVEENI
jgi:hypothetical protein